VRVILHHQADRDRSRPVGVLSNRERPRRLNRRGRAREQGYTHRNNAPHLEERIRTAMGSRRSKVLIVDDEDNIVLALHRVLYQANPRYDVPGARTAEIAQQILLDIPIDVLVTDVHLPEKSGMDLLCWAAVETPTTRVIVMTAFDVTGIKDKAHAFGCLRLMRKPFDVHEMRATILRALDRRGSLPGNLPEPPRIDVTPPLSIAPERRRRR